MVERKNQILQMELPIVIRHGWSALPLVVAEKIATGLVNKGMITATQYFQLAMNNFEQCVDGAPLGYGDLWLIDALDFITRIDEFSKSQDWGEGHDHIDQITIEKTEED